MSSEDRKRRKDITGSVNVTTREQVRTWVWQGGWNLDTEKVRGRGSMSRVGAGKSAARWGRAVNEPVQLNLRLKVSRAPLLDK